ncbi:hypothetical protein Tdes44962_MAKER00792 [Teratosphaeria destructans]|uniref:Uncharacterized protein n=1 Tax=Teratosphaeria destructans TaxID=418781 RepID=A0A9W7VZE7_9PEZI|nr:hypothetical protein Tdes44962_MAKER00792 [Teratosphaeria destructans]
MAARPESMGPPPRLPDPPLTYQPTFHYSPIIRSGIDFNIYHELLKSYVSTLGCLQYFASISSSSESADAALRLYARELQQKVLVIYQAMLDYLNEAVDAGTLDCSTAVRQSQAVRELLDTCDKHVVGVSAIGQAIEVTKVKRGSVTVVSIGSQLERNSTMKDPEVPSSPSSIATTIFDVDDDEASDMLYTPPTPPTPPIPMRHTSKRADALTRSCPSVNFSRRDVKSPRNWNPPNFLDEDVVDEDDYDGPATWHELPAHFDGNVERPESGASTFLYPLASTIALASRRGILRPRRPRR